MSLKGKKVAFCGCVLAGIRKFRVEKVRKKKTRIYFLVFKGFILRIALVLRLD